MVPFYAANRLHLKVARESLQLRIGQELFPEGLYVFFQAFLLATQNQTRFDWQGAFSHCA